MRDRTGGEVSFKMGDETGWFKFPVFAKSRCSDSLCVSGLHAVTRKIMKLTELINHGFQNIFTSKKSSIQSNLLIVENSDGVFLPENNTRILPGQIVQLHSHCLLPEELYFARKRSGPPSPELETRSRAPEVEPVA